MKIQLFNLIIELALLASCNVTIMQNKWFSFQSDIEISRIPPLIWNLTSILSCNCVCIAGRKPLIETYILVTSVAIHAVFLSFNWNSSAVGMVKLSIPHHSRSFATIFFVSMAMEGTGIRSDVWQGSSTVVWVNNTIEFKVHTCMYAWVSNNSISTLCKITISCSWVRHNVDLALSYIPQPEGGRLTLIRLREREKRERESLYACTLYL